MEKYKYQAAYDDRNGLISKSYKLNRAIVNDFKTTCQRMGISQAAQLQKMMAEYIKENAEQQAE